MKTFIISSCTYTIEATAELLLVRSFLGKKKKSLLSPLLLFLPLCGIANNFFFTFMPNVFGWFISLPISLLSYCFIIHISFSSGIFPFLFSYVGYGLIEAVTAIILPNSMSTSSNTTNELIVTCVICAICILISLLPLDRLYNFINSGNLPVRRKWNPCHHAYRLLQGSLHSLLHPWRVVQSDQAMNHTRSNHNGTLFRMSA